MSFPTFFAPIFGIIAASAGGPVHDHHLANEEEAKFVRAETSRPAMDRAAFDNAALTAAAKSILNTINNEDDQTANTELSSLAQSCVNGHRAEKDKILAARRHNRGIPLAKLPAEVRRQILKEVLPNRKVFKPRVGSTFNKTIRKFSRQVYHANSAKKLDAKFRKHSEAAAAATLVQAYMNIADAEHCSPEEFTLQAEAELRDCPSRPTKNFATTLMLIDSNVIGNVATSIMYEEQVFQIHISENGVDFLDLPRIERLQSVVGDHADTSHNGVAFFVNDGPFRFGRMKHLEFFIYSETVDKTAAFRMQQNIEHVVKKLLAEEQGPNSISINFESSLIRSWDEGGPMNNDFWVNMCSDGAHPRNSGIHSLSNIEFVTLPFEKLRNVANIEINLPEALKQNIELLDFQARVEGLMRGTTPNRNDLVAYEGALTDAFEEWRYMERCKEMMSMSDSTKVVEEDRSWFLTDAEMKYDSDDAVSNIDFDSGSDSEEFNCEEIDGDAGF